MLGPRRRSRGTLFGHIYTIVVAVALIGMAVAPVYEDLSRPGAWDDLWDRYISPAMTTSVLPRGYRDTSGRTHPALMVHGPIGSLAAVRLREAIDNAHLTAGDAVVLSSPGGDLNQAMLMGRAIRARGLVTMVGRPDGAGGVRAASCASACVIVFAGGTERIGVSGSRLGVHRFTSWTTGSDPVAEAQRTAGRVLGYVTSMGIAPEFVEAMSATAAVRWLGAGEARNMRLVTTPIANRDG